MCYLPARPESRAGTEASVGVKSIIRKISQPAPLKNPQPQDPYAELQRLTADIAEPIIFDVGAHRGYVATTFRKLIPSSTVHAFEPFPASFERLQVKVGEDKRVHTYNYGLGNTEGECEMHSNTSPATNSILPTDDDARETWGEGLLNTQETVRIRLKTLDAAAESIGVPRIDILKLDVQGAEPLVMEGAKAMCEQGRISFIYTEIITQPTYKGQKRFDQALSVFYERGFDLHNIFNLNSSPQGTLRQVDVIFMLAR